MPSRSSKTNVKRQRHDHIKVGVDKKNNQKSDDSNCDGKSIGRPRGRYTTDMVSFGDNIGKNCLFQPQKSHQSSSWPGTINGVVQQKQWAFPPSVNIPIRLYLAIQATKLTGTFGGGIMYTPHYGAGSFWRSYEYKFTGSKIGVGCSPVSIPQWKRRYHVGSKPNFRNTQVITYCIGHINTTSYLLRASNAQESNIKPKDSDGMRSTTSCVSASFKKTWFLCIDSRLLRQKQSSLSPQIGW